jgi:hypothetical protein
MAVVCGNGFKYFWGNEYLESFFYLSLCLLRRVFSVSVVHRAVLANANAVCGHRARRTINAPTLCIYAMQHHHCALKTIIH